VQDLDFLERFAGSASNARQWIVGPVDSHLRFVTQALGEPGQESTSTG
jgi:hypothetical protein